MSDLLNHKHVFPLPVPLKSLRTIQRGLGPQMPCVSQDTTHHQLPSRLMEETDHVLVPDRVLPTVAHSTPLRATIIPQRRQGWGAPPPNPERRTRISFCVLISLYNCAFISVNIIISNMRLETLSDFSFPC